MSKYASSKFILNTLSVLSPLSLQLVWELLARAGIIDTRVLSSPTLILRALMPLVVSGELLHNTLVSVQRVVLGFIAGSLPGVLLGLSMGLSPVVRSAIEPMIQATYPIPKLAIMPLIL